MKKGIITIIQALIASLAIAQESITFEVDKGLSAPTQTIQMYDDQEMSDDEDAQLRQRFPKATIKRTQRLKINTTDEQPTAAKKPQKVKAVKRGDKVSGTVTDAGGPLFGATVIEANEEGHTVGYAITDINGHFKLKIKNPQNKILVTYVGLQTVTLDISSEKYFIMMKPSPDMGFKAIPAF